MSETSSRRRWLALALYGVGTLLSFPHELPWGGHVDLGLGLFWLGPAALVVGLEGLDPRRAARVAFLASLVAHSVFFHWFAIVTVVYGGMPFWLGVLAPIVPAVYVSAFTALFAWAWAWARGGRQQPPSIWLGAVLWVAVDWARGHFMGGFPWATLGYALHLDTNLLVWTRWGGVYVLSFVAAGVGIAVARLVLDRDAASRHRLAAALGLVIAAHALGFAHIGASAPAGPDDPVVRVAAIQGNIDQGQKWDAERRQRILDGYLRLSDDAGREGVDWIVWPETALPGFLEYDAGLRSALAGLARRHEAALVVGGVGLDITEEGRPSAYFDSAFLLDRRGSLRDRYDKTHLVPFGEYVPLRDLFGRFFQALATGLSSTDIVPGSAARAIEMETGAQAGERVRVGVPICYELLFPHVVRRIAADRAGVLLAITNDAWYGRTGAPHQFLAMTALRSAENGLWTVRAANTGISAIIDDRGRVQERSPLFEEAVVIGKIPVSTSGNEAVTFYARYGDVFAGLCVLLTIAFVGREVFRTRGPSAVGAEDEQGMEREGVER